MGRHNDNRDRRENRNGLPGRQKKFNHGGGNMKRNKNRRFKPGDRGNRPNSSFNWHNWDRDPLIKQEKEDHRPINNDKERGPPPPGKFLVEKECGTVYEIDKELVKFTKTEPRIAYSLRPADGNNVPSPARHKTPELPVKNSSENAPEKPKTPEKLLAQLNVVNSPLIGTPETVKPKKDSKHKEDKLAKSGKKDKESKVELKPEIDIKVEKPDKEIRPEPLIPLSPVPERQTSTTNDKPKSTTTPDKDEPPIYDIFGEEKPQSAKKKNRVIRTAKLIVPKPATSLQQICTLYDDEDEEDMCPTNALKIGTNTFKPIAKREIKKEVIKETPRVETPTTIKPSTSLSNPPSSPTINAIVIKEERLKSPETPQKAPSTVIKREASITPPLTAIELTDDLIKPLDILKSLDNESTEVDDFLQQIQQQRQLIDEKLSNSVSPKKPLSKFKCIIDIDSMQKEINEKIDELPDEYTELPTIPLELNFTKKIIPLEIPVQLQNESKVSSSSSSSSSSSDDDDEVESGSESSSSTTSSSSSSSLTTTSSSSSSDSDSSSSDSDMEQKNKLAFENIFNLTVGNSTPPANNKLGIDLTLATRSPVMLKIQQKPRVIAPIPALVDDGEEDPLTKVYKIEKESKKQSEKEQQPSQRKSEKRREEDKKKDDRRERRRRERDDRRHRRKDIETSYDREDGRKSSSRSRGGSERRRRSSRDRDLLDELKVDPRRRSKDRDRRRRGRSISGSRSPPGGQRGRGGREISRSRSRSVSVEGRKRSPWRPPIDLWENLNVPTNSWAYNDDQYFSRAYYDESYNYFEQNQFNQVGGGGGDFGYNNNVQPQQHQQNHWQNHHHGPGAGSYGNNNNIRPNSPMRDSLDDRINNVLNGEIGAGGQAHHSSGDYSAVGGGGGGGYNERYAEGFINNNIHPNNNNNNRQNMLDSGSNYYDHQNHHHQHQYEQQYEPSANLLSIPCNETPVMQQQQQQTPFALQKGNVIELVPSQVTQNQVTVDQQANSNNNKCGSSSAQRKQIREKKRMEKSMRKKKLELELQQLLEGRQEIIEINIEGERKPSPGKKEEVVRKVIFSDGVLPGDGTSDSVLDSSDDSNTDLSEMTGNQLKKYRKKKRKKRSLVKSNEAKLTELPPLLQNPPPAVGSAVNVGNATVGGGVENGCAEKKEAEVEETALPVPPPPPNDPPAHLVQPSLKREVQERPKKLLYFNTCHRERRMDFFSIYVPFTMFIRLNDPRLLQGHPAIVNRRRIPQPIYPPNVYPPPPQPFQHLPPVQISGVMSNDMHNTGPIRHIPTIGDN